jgi:hypothetical protein
MIDWDKPIQAMDGRKVTVCRAVISRSGEGAKVVYVAPPPGAVFGDVFLVDEKGFRCDDSAPEEPVQIIRNAPVKREGWVNIYGVYKTEEEAKRASMDPYVGCQRFVRWEE